MTFLTYETSIGDGEPVFLYEFNRGGGLFRYTSCNKDVTTAGPITWTAIPIKDDGIPQSGNADEDFMTVTLPSTSDVPSLFSQTPPSQQMTLTIKAFHTSDPDLQVITIWIGTVSSCNIGPIGTAKLKCRTLDASFENDGVTVPWSRGCPYALYDPNTCKANKDDFVVNVTLAAVGSNVLTSGDFTAYPSPRFMGGFITWENTDGSTETRGIIVHDGNTATIMGYANGLVVGQTIKAYPGCLHTTLDCDTFFNDLPNYGGYPMMPGRSPFDGDPVY